MNFFRKKSKSIDQPKNQVVTRQRKQKKTLVTINLTKRQKFVIAVVFLSICLFTSGAIEEGTYAIIIAVSLALITDFFLLWSVYFNLKESFIGSIFILPFFYSFAFTMFYFLLPAVVLVRIIAVGVYALGLYSLFLSQNVFIVSSARTIALLSGARIVSFIVTILSYFFLTDTVFSLHLPILPMIGIVAVYSFLLSYQSIRTYALQKSEYPSLRLSSIGVTLCLVEAAAILWFWPSGPHIISIFLTGFFSTLVGLSHIWYERRLFRGVLWEYVWVGVVVFLILLGFTSWGK